MSSSLRSVLLISCSWPCRILRLLRRAQKPKRLPQISRLHADDCRYVLHDDIDRHILLCWSGRRLSSFRFRLCYCCKDFIRHCATHHHHCRSYKWQCCQQIHLHSDLERDECHPPEEFQEYWELGGHMWVTLVPQLDYC